MIIKFKIQRIICFVCSDFGGGWVGQQKSDHCSDFEIRWKKWTLPNGGSFVANTSGMMTIVTGRKNSIETPFFNFFLLIHSHKKKF